MELFQDTLEWLNKITSAPNIELTKVLKTTPKIYLLKKGPADPFRGDWYTDEKSFASSDEPIAQAAALTLADHNDYLTSWEEFGYEWSVFEKEGDTEKKIWEGYKYIKSAGHISNDITLGNI